MMEESANQYPAEEEARKYQAAEDWIKEREDKRESAREKLQVDYLRNCDQQAEATTPMGIYIVDCEDIEKGLPDKAKDLRLEIRHTETLGIFQADFHFEILEGVMIISSEKFCLE